MIEFSKIKKNHVYQLFFIGNLLNHSKITYKFKYHLFLNKINLL